MRSRLIVILFLLVFPINAFAQDIEGLEYQATRDEILSRFGNPIRYSSMELNDGPWQPLPVVRHDYHYDGMEIVVIEGQNIIDNCTVTSKNYRVLTKYLKGGIRVGETENDMLNKLSGLEMVCPFRKMGNAYYFWLKYEDIPVEFHIKNGVICKITISTEC